MTILPVLPAPFSLLTSLSEFSSTHRHNLSHLHYDYHHRHRRHYDHHHHHLIAIVTINTAISNSQEQIASYPSSVSASAVMHTRILSTISDLSPSRRCLVTLRMKLMMMVMMQVVVIVTMGRIRGVEPGSGGCNGDADQNADAEKDKDQRRGRLLPRVSCPCWSWSCRHDWERKTRRR